MQRLKYVFGFLILHLLACQSTLAPVQLDLENLPYKKLSEYHFFQGSGDNLKANEGVLPYDLNTPLFTDYAHKARFVWMPEGVHATVNEEGVLEFPDQSVLIKTFYYPKDFKNPSEGHDLVETRLLVKKEGAWEAFTYQWDADRKDASLNVIGDIREVNWVDAAGAAQQIQYAIPNKNQCKSCHNVEKAVMPIGPKVRNLRKSYTYADGTQDQLSKWQEMGYLQWDGISSETFPAVAVWDDPESGTVQDRALAYLDVNCGHCHNPKGPAHTSGLYLTALEEDPGRWGMCKIPIAAGKGSGGRRFGIAPGQPDSSILVFRMESNDPGIMMPELGRVIAHPEGVELVRNWIASMDDSCE